MIAVRSVKLTSRILLLVSVVLIVSSVVCVSAQWIYNETVVSPVSDTIKIKTDWTVLPNEEEDSEKGTNHEVLLKAIIEGENGLNVAGSPLNNAIKGRLEQWNNPDEVGSMAPVTTSDSELSNVFSSESEGLEFMIQFVDSNRNNKMDTNEYYYVYTTDIKLSEGNTMGGLFGTPNIPYDKPIFAVYRTKVSWSATANDGKGAWVQSDFSEIGTATSSEYPGLTGGWLSNIPAFEPNSWKAISDSNPLPGYESSNPWWTYAGRTNTIEMDSADQKAYFAFAPIENGSFRITSEQSLAVTVTQNGKKVNPANGVYSLNESNEYLITVSGADNITFVIEKQ